MMDYQRLSELSKFYSIDGISDLNGKKDWESCRDFINARYEDFLMNDARKIDEVMRVIRYRWFETTLKIDYQKNLDTIVDFIGDLSLFVLEKRILNFDGKVHTADDFYKYLMTIYKIAFKRLHKPVTDIKDTENEITASEIEYGLKSGEGSEGTIDIMADFAEDKLEAEDLNETEQPNAVKRKSKKRIFHITEVPEEYRKDGEDFTFEPYHVLFSDEEMEDIHIRCNAFLASVLDSPYVPHETICCCYSVILPQQLNVILQSCAELYNAITPALEYVWENVYSPKYKGENKEALYGHAYEEKYRNLLLNDEDYRDLHLPFPLDEFCFSNIVIPKLLEIRDEEMTDQLIPRARIQFIRRLADELEAICPDAVNVNRKSLINAKAAQFFMEDDNVRTMSKKFLLLLNGGELGRKDYDWGIMFKHGLESGYYKNNHNIECDGDVVISEYFSSPSGKNAVVNEEYDYLIGNIQQFSKRTFQSFLKKSYDSLPLELQVHSRRNSETLRKYLFKEQVCNTAKKIKGKGAVCDASIR